MRLLALGFVPLLLIAECGKTETDQYLLSLDKQKLTESLNYDKIYFYKFAKIAIRFAAVKETNTAEFQLFAKK